MRFKWNSNVIEGNINTAVNRQSLYIIFSENFQKKILLKVLVN